MKYRPGQWNRDANALLRHLHNSLSPNDEWEEIPALDVRAIRQVVSTQRSGCPSFPCAVHQICSHESVVPKAYCHVTTVEADQLPIFSINELQAAQRSDPCIGEFWQAVTLKKPASNIQTKYPDMKVLKKEWAKLSIDKKVLYRTVKQGDQWVKQLVLPCSKAAKA